MKANTDDVLCEETVVGCTDETQFNYNPSANTDDGMCIAFEYGCTDPTAFNYDEGANTDDGTCITDCVGEECCSSGTQWDLNSLTCSFEDTCPADIVRNGSVTVTDLLELLSAFELCDVPELGSGGEFCIAAECCGLNTSWCTFSNCAFHIAWFCRHHTRRLRGHQRHAHISDLLRHGVRGFQWSIWM